MFTHRHRAERPPSASPGAPASRVADAIASRYAACPRAAWARALHLHGPTSRGAARRALAELLPLAGQHRVLDVGCGAGQFLERVLATGAGAAGLDPSPRMLGLAARRNRDAVASARLVLARGTAEQLPFPDAAFTHVTMLGVLDFVAGPAAALREARRVLGRGGRLTIINGSARQGRRLGPAFLARRLLPYCDEDVLSLAAGAGFTAVTLTPTRRGGRVLHALA